MPDSDFLAHILDLLSPWGAVTARKMFGGYGIYRRGTMFALIADDELYFKVDAENRPTFEAAGMRPFTYEGKSKPIAMSYWQAPPDVLDESSTLIELARGALDAALRSRQIKSAAPRAKSRQR
ncbi:MAG: TfoX/Sxy family protein [Proteobacteria bacterium]|nr:TfoX/Sxy family protein [Pseudomonadota bacterium]